MSVQSGTVTPSQVGSPFPLGAVVQLSHRGHVEGRIINRTEYLEGYSLYVVECFVPKVDEPLKVERVTVHENEMKIVSLENTVACAEPAFGLGARVLIKPIPAEGLVTGVSYSISGCAESEVSFYEPTKGIARQLLGPDLLEAVPDVEKAKVGAATGSVLRTPASR